MISYFFRNQLRSFRASLPGMEEKKRKTSNLTYASLWLTLFLFSCSDPTTKSGYLHVAAGGDGQYEVFLLQESQSQPLLSQGMGVFNQAKALPPGQYVLLADCSYKTVTLYAGQTTKEWAHQVTFTRPLGRTEEDLFLVRCNRYPQIHAVQEIRNRFHLWVFGGKTEIWAGMSSLTFSPSISQSESLRFPLAAVRVVATETHPSYGEIPYFVSQLQHGVSITQGQKANQWQFLLPGDYSITMNGTEQIIKLAAGQIQEIQSASLRFSAEGLEEAEYTRLTGSPPLVYIEDQYPFAVNADILVLAGALRYRLDGSRKTKTLQLQSGEKHVHPLNTIWVESGCATWDLECAGQRKIYLYEVGSAYPFLESISDVPILYEGEDLLLGLEGSRGIQYRLPKQPHARVKIGKVKVIPQPVYQPGYSTDLLRLEATQSTQLGVSHDISFEKPTVFTLLVGNYRLMRYTNAPNNQRNASDFTVSVQFAKETVKIVPFYLPLPKYQKMQKKFEEWTTPHPHIDSYFIQRF